MTIETKYNVGDEVWYADVTNKTALPCKVHEVSVNIGDYGTIIHYVLLWGLVLFRVHDESKLHDGKVACDKWMYDKAIADRLQFAQDILSITDEGEELLKQLQSEIVQNEGERGEK